MKEIDERKQIEATLRQSEEKYRSLLQANPDPVVVYDNEGRVIFFNPAFRRTFGWTLDERLNKKMDIFVPVENQPETKMMIDKVKANKKFSNIESRRYNKAGNIIPVSISGAAYRNQSGDVLGCIVNLRDISEQKMMEAQLRQAQKMEAIGVLASGVAHDFNNLLTTILVNTELILSDDIDSSLKERIEDINKAGQRAAALTRQLLAFSRKQVIQPKVLNLNKLLKDFNKMLDRIIGEDVEILVIPEDALWQIEIDPGQMEQVIFNLVINAKDVMPKGGQITIETENVNHSEGYFYQHGVKSQPGSYIKLAVSDTGSGMDNETQKKIFEPFFTTKKKGKGTGLGLSIVYGIVKQNNGFVWVYSEPGQGSSFKVYLPKAPCDVATKRNESPTVRKADGSETLLIVEDDEQLRKTLRTTLKQNGYKVLDAKNGKDALKICKKHEGMIELMITDVVMPKMSGRETVRRLQPLYPQMKIIYMSGYTDNAIVNHGILASGLDFLQKPFSLKDLGYKVREILDQE